MQHLQLVAMQTLIAGVTVGLWLLAWQVFKFLGLPWLILLWPIFAAISHNRNRSVEAIAIWHAIAASYIAWGLFTGFWYPPHRSQVALFNGPAWLPWAGWGVWTLSVVIGLLAGVLAGAKTEDRFSSYALVPWPVRHRQASYVLAFFGLWMIGYGGHSILVPLIVTALGMYQGSVIFGDSGFQKSPNRTGLARNAAPPTDELAGADPATQGSNGAQSESPASDAAALTPAARTYPPDNGSAHAASQRELAALRRAVTFDQLAQDTSNPTERVSLQRDAQTAHVDAERWAQAVRARLGQGMRAPDAPASTLPVRPLTKNALPALLPMTYPADFRALERWAARVGASVQLSNGGRLNTHGERWTAMRIDGDLPALALPEAAEVWQRTRALLWPESWPTDDDWLWEGESPDALLRHPDAQFAVVKDGEVAIPGRLVDVADLRCLEEILAVEGSWAARHGVGKGGAGERQAPPVSAADRRLIERHAYAIGTPAWFDDGTEINTYGERWAQPRIDAELPVLSVARPR